MIISLKGQAGVVTGAASGIGRGIANGLAAAGADVALADINEEGAQKAAEEIAEEFGVRTLAVKVDVTSGAATACRRSATTGGTTGASRAPCTWLKRRARASWTMCCVCLRKIASRVACGSTGQMLLLSR